MDASHIGLEQGESSQEAEAKAEAEAEAEAEAKVEAGVVGDFCLPYNLQSSEWG